MPLVPQDEAHRPRQGGVLTHEPLPTTEPHATEQRPAAVRPPAALVGPVLVGIAVLHTAFTPVFQPAFGWLLSAKLLAGPAAVTLSEKAMQESGFWYVVTGLGLGLLGGLAWWVERQGLRLPTALGVALLALSFAGLLLGPVTGFWLFLLPGALILLRRRVPAAIRA